MRTNVKTQSANRLVVKLDGKQVGLAQSARANDDYSPEPASGIGDIHVHEYVPTQARHVLNLAKMALIKSSLRSQGLEPENGDAVLQGVVFDILVQSKDTGAVLRKYIGCSYASGDVEVTKHQIVTTNAVFNCLDVKGDGL
ncbi:MAG TPA: hypothetical protein VFM97_00075 [Gammaproteobacteria bacterium]|nr:hypothetical protein [Gammaproteobacteria bacterium]